MKATLKSSGMGPHYTRELVREQHFDAWAERLRYGRLDLYTLNTVARAHTFAGEVGGIVPRSKVRPS